MNPQVIKTALQAAAAAAPSKNERMGKVDGYGFDYPEIAVKVQDGNLRGYSTNHHALSEVIIPAPHGCEDTNGFRQFVSVNDVATSIIAGNGVPESTTKYELVSYEGRIIQRDHNRETWELPRMATLDAIRRVFKTFPRVSQRGEWCTFQMDRGSNGTLRISRPEESDWRHGNLPAYEHETDIEIAEGFPPFRTNFTWLRNLFFRFRGKTLQFSTGEVNEVHPAQLESTYTRFNVTIQMIAAIMPVD